MNKIVITDNESEMEVIGRSLYKDRNKVYTERVSGMIRSTIDELAENLSDAEKEHLFFTSIYDYWVYGVNTSEDLYYHFLGKSHTEKSKYLTYRNRQSYYSYLNNPEDLHILRNKYEAYKHFKSNYARDVILISDKSDFEVFSEFVGKHQTFVVKPTDLSCAVGVHRDHVRSNESIKDTFERLLDEINEVYEKAYWGKTHSFVLEEWIVQSKAFSKLYPGSVNAVRCTTVYVDGEVHIFYPWVKIGARGADIASAAIGGIDAGVDPKTGKIGTVAFDERLQSYNSHPDTGIEFIGYQIPRWDELISTVTELAKKIPTVKYIGWDMVLTENGWIVIEGNDGGEFLGQLMWGRGFKQDFEELIHWKPTNSFWWE